MQFPEECPNCLTKPTDCIVHFSITVGIDFLRVTYKIDIPHCQTCVDFITQKKKLIKRYSIYTLLVLGAVIIGLTALSTLYNISGTTFIYGSMTFPIILIVFWARYRKLESKIPINPGSVKRGYAVELIRCIKRTFSDKSILSIKFLNPRYAKLFIEKNKAVNPKYNKYALEHALNRLELKGPV